MKNTNWKVPVIIGVGVLAVILMIVFGVQSSQNKAIALEEQVNTASSDIKVQEKRRVDLVYNLADCVKQYDKHEADTLTAVADGRGSTGDIENVTTAITAVAEAYPELKSNENYKTLMNELSMTENMIAEYRSNYNKQIKEYKRYVRKFPTRQFLGLLGYEVQEYEYLDYNAPVDAPQDLFKEDQYYTKHTKTVYEYDDDGNVIGSHEEEYWTWDLYDSDNKHCDKVTFLGIEFDYGQIYKPYENYIDTIDGDYHVRYVYYGSKTEYTGTIFTKLDNHTINKTEFYKDMNINDTVDHLQSNVGVIVFWIFWIILIGGMVFGFYYLDNRWLDQ